MSVLEWILILEFAAIGIAAIMAGVAAIIAKSDPNDPIAVFCNTFWREFLSPPAELPFDAEPAASAAPVRRSSYGHASVRSGADDASDSDAIYGRTQKDEQGRVKKVELAVLVEPHAPTDEVAGRDGDGLKVRVTGEAGDSRSNKALVEIVATAMGVKPYQVTLTKGHYQTRKAVQIQGLSPDELEGKLEVLPQAE